jgi:hypothetical protein
VLFKKAALPRAICRPQDGSVSCEYPSPNLELLSQLLLRLALGSDVLAAAVVENCDALVRSKTMTPGTLSCSCRTLPSI